jgi:hypothetical protein
MTTLEIQKAWDQAVGDCKRGLDGAQALGFTLNGTFNLTEDRLLCFFENPS